MLVAVWAVRLIAAGRSSLDGVFHRFTGFAGALLYPAKQFFLLAFAVLEIVVRELGPLLLQLTLGDVPVAFDFECSHSGYLFAAFRFDSPPTWRQKCCRSCIAAARELTSRPAGRRCRLSSGTPGFAHAHFKTSVGQ